MKYDEMNLSDSYSYEHNNITRDKIGRKRRYDPLDIAVVCSIFGVIISTTVLISRLMSSGIISSVMSTIV